MTRKRWLVLVAVGAGVFLFGADRAHPQEGDAMPGYAGGEICAECHDVVASDLAMTHHGKAAFSNQTTRGCEACHGPSEAHLDDPEVVENQPRIADWTAGEVNEMCQSCHDGGGQFFWNSSHHEARGLSCTDCHAVHEYESEVSQLKAATVEEQCYSCHKAVRADTWKRSHHPIREGKISCNDCHNPHGTQAEKMITAASINDQCYSCHTEKRGPFLWEHPPVREDCTACHVPHGSNHLKLQKTSVPYICQQCHSNTRHPGTLYDRTTLADGSRPSNRDFSRACLNCHSAIHGSNHPSSPYLGH